MKYLIVGLGNIGEEYKNTRHNIGFMVLDALSEASNIVFDNSKRYGSVAEYKFKGKTFILLKPSTYMNLSGNAVRYWMQKENIEQENVLIVVDDLALPLGALRLRSKGSDAGHNGLKHITQILGNQDYSRLRFGIGCDFGQGQQVNYVLGKWGKSDLAILKPRLDIAVDMIQSFGLIGVAQTMTMYNNK